MSAHLTSLLPSSLKEAVLMMRVGGQQPGGRQEDEWRMEVRERKREERGTRRERELQCLRSEEFFPARFCFWKRYGGGRGDCCPLIAIIPVLQSALNRRNTAGIRVNFLMPQSYAIIAGEIEMAEWSKASDLSSDVREHAWVRIP